ncbi:MAG: hypothetical protein LBT05_03015 [Planctomycetaceae bacterium]|jgi:hypothetical protein|nr:hypothetical protein [Planctomycetaceae bacterium]
MNDDEKVFQLITKLIYDTNSNKIYWSCEENGNHWQYHASYENKYELDFCSFHPKGTLYVLRLLENRNQLLEIQNLNSLSDLHDAIQEQTGCGKIDDAIDYILNH